MKSFTTIKYNNRNDSSMTMEFSKRIALDRRYGSFVGKVSARVSFFSISTAHLRRRLHVRDLLATSLSVWHQSNVASHPSGVRRRQTRLSDH